MWENRHNGTHTLLAPHAWCTTDTLGWSVHNAISPSFSASPLSLFFIPLPLPSSQLLWTAPELLRTGVSHLDHVGAGTVEGDMYSLAQIMMEMLTHDMPFSDLMNYIDVADVLRAVAGVKNVSSHLPQVHAVCTAISVSLQSM